MTPEAHCVPENAWTWLTTGLKKVQILLSLLQLYCKIVLNYLITSIKKKTYQLEKHFLKND